MSDIKVSVIIPVYNVENYLERAVDSVLNQTLSDIEIILVDDGSPDQSPKICDNYARMYPGRIKVIHNQNEGLGFARNSGLKLAKGEYVAFIDSDDTLEPDMYESMYNTAVLGGCDIVMCDVNIVYVGKGMSKISKCYPHERVSLGDYIKNGENITYSVNKLFRRSLWQSAEYEKMLFEDIALIPALLSHAKHLGYVSRPFYNYYRREGTLSTTDTGGTADIIKAYERFLDRCDMRYSDEMAYAAAKQILWNMTQSRTLFEADFIDFINRYKSRLLLNPYIAKDKNVKRILDYIDKSVIEDNIICPALDGPPPEGYLENISVNFTRSSLIIIGPDFYDKSSLPQSVNDALFEGDLDFASGYFALRALYEMGGIVVAKSMRAGLGLKRLRLQKVFFGFEGDEQILDSCFGAQKHSHVIQALLLSFEGDNIYNRARLRLCERIRDFLIISFGLKPNGRRQLLGDTVEVLLPSVLAYDLKDGQNCCKKELFAPPGHELVSESVLKLWSQRIMENWNLYKSALGEKNVKPQKQPMPQIITKPDEAYTISQVEKVIANYESSTSWKVTRPLRALGRLIKRGDRSK